MEKIAPIGMAFLFIMSQLIAVLVAIPFKKAGMQAFPEPDNPMNIVQIFLVLIIFTIIILIIAKYRENMVRYIILFAFFFASLSIFQAFFYFLEDISFFIALAISIVMLILFIKYPEWYVIDTFGVFLAGGISAIFAISLSIKYIILLLIILSIYDFVSVYKTKHMVELAKTITSSNLPLLMIFPKKSSFSYIKSGFGGKDAIYMGLGDIIIPGMLIVASYIEKGFIGFITTITGALIGFIILMFVISKGPQPGLPFLNAGCIVGYAIAYFL